LVARKHTTTTSKKWYWAVHAECSGLDVGWVPGEQQQQPDRLVVETSPLKDEDEFKSLTTTENSLEGKPPSRPAAL